MQDRIEIMGVLMIVSEIWQAMHFGMDKIFTRSFSMT